MTQTEDLIENAKGKPCGDSHIAAGDTCHVGETATHYGSKQKAIDKAAVNYVTDMLPKDAFHDQAMYEAENILGEMQDVGGFKSRTKIYETDSVTQDNLAGLLKPEAWPKAGPMADLVADMREGAPHSFIRVGDYALDPYLTNQGVDPSNVKEFCRRMAEVMEKAGIEPRGIEQPPHKPIASTMDILGVPVGQHTVADDEGEDLHQEDWTLHKHQSEPAKTYGPWRSAGAVVFNDKGEVAVRKVKGGYGGYNFSWGKGRVEDGESDDVAAHREVMEEQGHAGKIVADLGDHKGSMSTTKFFLMKHESDHPEKMDKETESVHWLNPVDAADKLDSARDLRVLIRAMAEMPKHLKP